MMAMIQSIGFKNTDKMRDLVSNNSSLILVMGRFGISLGFGDKSVREVCRAHGVDENTFLEVVNFVSNRNNTLNFNSEKCSIFCNLYCIQRLITLVSIVVSINI